MPKDDLIGGSLWERYSSKVAARMNDPQARGELTEEDAQKLDGRLIVADYGAESCGDAVRLYWVVSPQGKILAAKFKSFGCGTAIAASDMMVEMTIGKTVDEAVQITNIDVEQALRDNPDEAAVPPQKMHCSVMAYDVIKEAAAIYYGKEKSDFDDNEIVCECARVKLRTIKDAIRINNLTTVEEITNYTKAGAFCKSCVKPGGHEAKKYYLVDILRETRAEMAKEAGEEPAALKFEDLSGFQQGKRLEEYLQAEILPLLARDGGSATIADFSAQDGRFIVKLKFAGACAGCAGANTGTRTAIELAMQSDISPNIKVELV
ncbi:MAG: iron-sulfur cluster assembly scaffold protein [Spirochaetaceae bacterium]|nr:iron-sulfur cluster assembly scaffold protein [Spirochaetaceae bacterium]